MKKRKRKKKKEEDKVNHIAHQFIPQTISNKRIPPLQRKTITGEISVFCFNLQWNKNRQLSWLNFLQTIIGSEDPALAPEKSLRKIIFNEWQELELFEPPNLINNCIYVSNNAFEAFAERSIWLESPWLDDPVGCRLYYLGLTPDVVSRWITNPYFKGKFLFDRFDCLGAVDTLATIEHIMETTHCKFVIFFLLSYLFFIVVL